MNHVPFPGDNTALLHDLRLHVGSHHVLTGPRLTRRFCKGYRYGTGQVLAVVRPGTLLEMWRVLQTAVNAGKIIIMQAANTGLTGGSTPDGNDYDRDIILISTLRLRGIQPINEGKQVICLPGATLDALEKILKPLKREPHSVIGSSCIGASVLGGVCNNSGGALVRRGPAYTELALYAHVNTQGQLELVNHLGIHLGDTPEEILSRVENGEYSDADISHIDNKPASYPDYASKVRDIDADSPARFNADPCGHHEASGSAGKLAVFALRLDTFSAEPSQVFYIGTNNADDLTYIRRYLLIYSQELPIAAEYIHKEAFDIGQKYGKDVFLLIDRLGTDKVPAANNLKSRMDGWFERIGQRGLSDRLIQTVVSKLPEHLPQRMLDFRQRYEHHLLLRVANNEVDSTRKLLHSYFKQNGEEPHGDFFECDAEEGRKAFLHRFAVASAAIRYCETHSSEVEDILALDIALRRNDLEWFEKLPESINYNIIHKLYYGHFFCHVFHQDYIVKKGVDVEAIKHEMLKLLDQRGAEYPAEHNVGHLYEAKPVLKQFYQRLDPCNTFNPGIGKTSKKHYWGEAKPN